MMTRKEREGRTKKEKYHPCHIYVCVKKVRMRRSVGDKGKERKGGEKTFPPWCVSQTQECKSIHQRGGG